MSTIDELRGLVARASKGDTISIFQLRHRLEENAPALLAVAEAARKVVQHTADFDLETALARLDGEVG